MTLKCDMCSCPPPPRPLALSFRLLLFQQSWGRSRRAALEVYWQIGVSNLHQRVLADAIEQVGVLSHEFVVYTWVFCVHSLSVSIVAHLTMLLNLWGHAVIYVAIYAMLFTHTSRSSTAQPGFAFPSHCLVYEREFNLSVDGEHLPPTPTPTDNPQKVMNEPFFDQLRTKEQLGYSVGCSPRVTCGVLAFCVTVQSAAYGPAHLYSRVRAFMASFRETLVRPFSTHDASGLIPPPPPRSPRT